MEEAKHLMLCSLGKKTNSGTDRLSDQVFENVSNSILVPFSAFLNGFQKRNTSTQRLATKNKLADCFMIRAKIDYLELCF